MERDSEQSFLALWESNRGCPFGCTFCDWGSATAMKVNQFDKKRIFDEIEWIGRNKIEFVFVCDANFGLLPRDEEIAEFAVATKSKFGYPHAFSVQNTKNVKERAFRVQEILSKGGLSKGVTLSMQSLHTETLKLIKRDNISLESYDELQRRFRDAGVLTYSDLILGLPGETLETWVSGISRLIENGQHNRIQFNNLSLLPNAEMNSQDERTSHGFVTVKSLIVNVHGARTPSNEDIPEWQELVVATKTMPREDWIKARVFAWWVGFLYFDKIAQIPLILTSRITNKLIGQIVWELFNEINSDCSEESDLVSINKIFVNHALNIQNGGVEYIWNSNWLDVFWPADEYALIGLVDKNALSSFYEDLIQRLKCFCENNLATYKEGLVFSSENIGSKLTMSPYLNHFLLRLPIHLDLIEAPDFTQSEELLKMVSEFISFGSTGSNDNYRVFLPKKEKSELNFVEWMRKVVWYGHRSGAYLEEFYKKTFNNDDGKEIPGHFS
jgi:hypothetical protein